MPLTMLPMGIEALNIALVWIMTNSFDYSTKTILTLAVIIKCAFCFVAAMLIEDDRPVLRNLLLLACTLTNGGIIVFSIITDSQMLLINNAVLLVLLVVWSFLAVFEISWVWGKKK